MKKNKINISPRWIIETLIVVDKGSIVSFCDFKKSSFFCYYNFERTFLSIKHGVQVSS